jgi:lambda family phage portal protein
MKSNVLDRVIAWFAPELGVKRVQNRVKLEAMNYAGAAMGRRTAGWASNSASANAVISAALPTLRARSRELVRNNPLARKAVSEITTRAIGTGITPQPRTKAGDKVDKVIRDAWDIWVNQANSEGHPGFYGAQRLMLRCLLECGEGLYRHRPRRFSDGLRVPYQIELLEPDFLDHNKTENTANGYIINGVEFDALRRRTAYWLFDAHPGDSINTAAALNRSSLVSRRVPARDIEHGRLMDRLHQQRGVPLAASVLLKHRDLEDYEDATLMQKKIAACLALFVTKPSSSDAETLGPVIEQGATGRVEQIEPGMIEYLRAGEDIKVAEPPDAPGYADYVRAMHRTIAAGWNIPYEVLTGDLSQINYSSYRGGLIGYRDWLEALQWDYIIPFMCEPVYRRFIDALYLEGSINAIDYAVEWGTPKFDLLDRMDESKADGVMLGNGTMTFGQACTRQGNDPETQFAQLVYWNERFKKAGLQTDWLGKESNAASQPK